MINGRVKRGLQSGNTKESELVGGWPKWLIYNIPREALAGLVPKSAEFYDKLDKVELIFFPNFTLVFIYCASFNRLE